MSIRSVAKVVGDIPYMSPTQAKRMADLIKSHRLQRVLELGFAHGVSTCYIADAVKKMPEGSVTAIDLAASRKMDPTAENCWTDVAFRRRWTHTRAQVVHLATDVVAG